MTSVIRTFLAAFTALLGVMPVWSQNTTETLDLSEMFYIKEERGQGKVKIQQDSRLQQIYQTQIKANAANKELPGWRLQIYFGSGHNAREQAQAVRQTFIEDFPGVQAYLVHESPYFKVRVGDFRTRLDAVRFKTKIEKYYSTAWIIKDKVDYTKF